MNRRLEQTRMKRPGGHDYHIDLAAHMAQCDANYLRLMALFPAMRETTFHVFYMPHGSGRSQIRLEVVERARYTTLIHIRQLPTAPWSQSHLFTIRLYHDARSAEVVAYQGDRNFAPVYSYPNSRMYHRDEKAQTNRLLGEYLAWCQQHGASPPERALTHTSHGES